MSLFDLFKPKWRHSDSNVRRTAVEKLNDQTLLATVARTDRSPGTRKVALKKLTDKNVSKSILEEILVERPPLGTIEEEYYDLINQNTEKAMLLNIYLSTDVFDIKAIISTANSNINAKYFITELEMADMEQRAKGLIEMAKRAAEKASIGNGI